MAAERDHHTLAVTRTRAFALTQAPEAAHLR
jgi:hypothetical protein